MRCKTCDYRLWNIAARQCPECGTPFKPSEFEFAANSVRFLCPHCRQAYYGDGPGGHLNPIEFTCATCAQQIHMDQTILLPTEGVAEERTQIELNPWQERARLGLFKAWFKTIGRAMAHPQQLMRSTKVQGSTMDAVSFAVISSLAFSLVGVGPFILFPLLAMAGGGRGAATVAGFFMLMPLIPTVGTYLYILLWTLSTHGILMMSGPRVSGMGRTAQAICFSSGVNACSAVPCLGIYTAWIGWIWWPVSATLMVREAQGVSGTRATCATLALPLTLVLALLVGGAVAMYYVGQMTQSMGPFPLIASSAVTANHASTLGSEIVAYTSDASLPPLRHAAQLFNPDAAPIMDEAEFILPNSKTTGATIPVGQTTLQQLLTMNEQDQRQAIEQAVAALPDGVVAHRMGDVVFTWHGMDWSDPAAIAHLWVAIYSHDPAVNPTSQPPQITVVKADGDHLTMSAQAFALAQQQQNQLRAAQNLPPLPNPGTVTHQQPALALPIESP